MGSWRGSDVSLARLLGFVTLASLLPLVLLGAYGLHSYIAQQRQQELNEISAHAESLARAIDRELRSYIEVAQILAKSRFLQHKDIGIFEALARDAAAATSIGTYGGHILLYDRSGQQLLNTRAARGAALPRTAHLEANQRVIDTGRPVIDNLGTGAFTQQLVFGARVPVMIEGEVAYVLAFVPSQHTIADILRDPDRPARWLAYVVDGNGRIIAPPNNYPKLLGNYSLLDAQRKAEDLDGSGFFEAEVPENHPSFAAFHASRLSSWHVYVWVAKEVLEAPGRRAFFLILAVLAGTLCFSAISGFSAGLAIQEPARRLVDAARALAGGKPVNFKRTLMREANVVGASIGEAAREISHRERHSRLIMRELTHRTKNLLAIIQAMARQTARSSENTTEFLERFGARISGLARSHDLLVEANWEGADLATLIATQLAPFVEDLNRRVSMKGPSLVLRPAAAQNLGMALYELATNANKHGALSHSSGRIGIEWEERVDARGEATFRMRWRESRGPTVLSPCRSGFGRAILEHLVPQGLGGTAHFDWSSEGVIWSLEVPATCLEKIAEQVQEAQRNQSS